MGFMDKAKRLAEQAQQKLDEAQEQFNQKSPPGGDGQGASVSYDEHGRPIGQTPPSGDAAPKPDPAAPPPAGGAHSTPDPFRPLD